MLPFLLKLSAQWKKRIFLKNHSQKGKLFLGVGVDRKIRVALKIKQRVGGNVCGG